MKRSYVGCINGNIITLNEPRLYFKTLVRIKKIRERSYRIDADRESASSVLLFGLKLKDCKLIGIKGGRVHEGLSSQRLIEKKDYPLYFYDEYDPEYSYEYGMDFIHTYTENYNRTIFIIASDPFQKVEIELHRKEKGGGCLQKATFYPESCIGLCYGRTEDWFDRILIEGLEVDPMALMPIG